MNRDHFWQIVEQAKAASEGDLDAQTESIRQSLAQLPPEEIIAFEEEFLRLRVESYRQDLWAAAYIINGGCSDDGFDYFRGWLIAQGRSVFDEALRDPATLINTIESLGEGDADYEEILYVAQEAYEQQTGKEIPNVRCPKFELRGDDWDEENVEALFPELAKLANARFN